MTGTDMDELKLDLEHCYGIRRLEHTFNFTQCKAVAIYAPNGAMKSSLAKTFQDIATGKKSSDRMFPDRKTKRIIVDEHGAELDPQTILVVRPYDKEFAPGDQSSTLLVNAVLRKDYETLNAGVEDAKKTFLSAMKEQSGSKRDLAAEISATFTRTENQFLTALLRINDEIKVQSDAPFGDIPYDLVFDSKVVEMLENAQVQEALEDYVNRFNELIDQSAYFKRGTFTYYNATEIAKALEANGFFDAAHSVSLNADEQVEITTKKQLEDLIKAEKEGIAADAKLRKTFEAVEKLLHRNVSVRDFNAFISDREEIVPALSNIGNFKEQVWKSYIVKHRDAYDRLVAEIREADERRKQIEEAARNERTAWQEVIDIFNSRFFVPFELSVKNLASAVLEGEIPKLGFTFKEGDDRKDVDKNALLEVLSTGEQKALYILNIIFEVQIRIKAGQRTLMIVDDVADSFDYKNKYAIIQYLKDISEDENFRQIILTHNFDFFRTLESRFLRRDSCFMVARKEGGIEVSQAVGIRNIFVNDWKVHFGTTPRKRIASIPFMRNLVEFTKGTQDPDYIALTALLHVKADTATITDAELFEFYSRIFGTAARNATPTADTALDLIYREADGCLVEADGANFENKIVLSIATRLRAEQYMIGRIDDSEAVENIRGMQTTALLKCFKERFPNDVATAVMDRVVLMTPENIHLNSFMYEPILDMSDEHLRRIYGEVTEL